MLKGSCLTRAFGIPKSLTFGPVSVQIDGGVIRAIYLKKKGNLLYPAYFTSMKIPKGGENAVSLSLSRLVKEAGSEYISFVLPEKDSYVSKMELPNESLASVREAIGYKLEEYIPLSLGESVFDYEILPHHDDHVDASVSAAPVQKINELVHLSEEVGAKIVSVIAEPVAIVKALIEKKEHKDILIVHLSASQATFVIVRDALPMFSSSLSVDLTVPPNAKEIIMLGKAKEAHKAIKGVFGSVLDEVKRVSSWWKSRVIKDEAETRGQLEGMIISGEAALIPGLASLFGEYAETEVSIGNPWIKFNLPKSYIPKISKAEALALVPVIGASLISDYC